MVTDIFIKTYHKDFHWLEYCLRSIAKFCSGFRNVVIVSDEDGHKLPEHYLSIVPNTIVHYVPMPSGANGYLWQQVVKLEWFKYSNADRMVSIDSDSMFHIPTQPKDFERNGKLVWTVRPWSEADIAITWRDVVIRTTGMNPPYECMCVCGFNFDRKVTVGFYIHFCKHWGVKSMWEAFVKHRFHRFSEFNAFGTFIVLTKPPQYEVYDWKLKNYHDCIFHSQSRDPISVSDKLRRDALIA